MDFFAWLTLYSRMTGSVVDLPEGDLTRKVTFWDSCEEGGTLLDR